MFGIFTGISMSCLQTLRFPPLAGRYLKLALLSLAVAAALTQPPLAAEAIVKRGDAAVTGFSGAKVWGKVPDGASPTDVTFINPAGAVLHVFNLERLGGPPTGALVSAPSTYQAAAGDIGQVFGVAFDSDTAKRAPNIYVTATSLFGLQIVSKDGQRLVKGEPGARWMPGQFGIEKGGGPGSVWKIDGVTGAASLFANLTGEGGKNAGPGLGTIAYDPASQQLFVTDLEYGLIHRLGLDGSIRGSFDHGIAARAKVGLDPISYDRARRLSIDRHDFNVEEPSTWGFADAGRRVFAVAVQDGRVYYSVAKPQQIWSVGLHADGSFADDARVEIDIKDLRLDNFVASILFDGAGTLYVSERGGLTGTYDYSVFAKLEKPIVRRYQWSDAEKRWSEDAGEYAVGLKDPYRSTLGGIALSYAYGNEGQIDYGKCRQTLWTTGEHLREGPDKERDYKGGARVVHGLQATDKANVRPLNEPPYATWFVDNDGEFDDINFYGRVGDVAIYDPCDEPPVANTEPAPPLNPPAVPQPQTGVWISKVCNPAPFGGPIHCTITVTNSSGAIPEQPITIWDAATILAGPGAGGAVTISAVAPDIPNWLCSATPTPNLSCTLAPDWLPPGASHAVDVTVDTAPLVAGGNNGFRNCAVLSAPWFGEACAEGGTQLAIVKTAPAACALGGDCTFGVTVINTGSLSFSGDVALTDTMFMGGGPALPAPIVIAPPLACAPAPAAVPFACTAVLTLAPGASQAFSITATLPAGPAPGYWAHNCIAVSASDAPPPVLPPAAPGAGSVSCAWVPVGAPVALYNLRLVKTALNAGKCAKMPFNVIVCDYEIDVINDGPSPYHGMLSVDETVPAASTLTVADPAWACAGGPPVYGCNTLAAVDIAVGASLKTPVTISIPLAPLEAAGCTLPNTAKIVAPAGGGNDNFNPADDTDTAFADAFLSWVDAFGVLQVTCDPTNLMTKKVSKGDCRVSGAGFLCEYTITVTNTGPDPYHGPLKLDEDLGFAPTSVSFSPDWGCVGGGAAYQCTKSHVDIKKKESVELKVSVQVPDTGRCELINRAVTIFPVAGTRYNKDGADDLASATAKIPSKSCKKPDRERCEPGENEMRSESGACVCKTGFIRDDNHRCVAIIEPVRCPDGTPVPKNGRCLGTKPVCDPGPNEMRTDDGHCVCKTGYERDDRGRCAKKEAPLCEPGRNEYRDDANHCVCKRGFERDQKGRCVEIPKPQCQPGPNEYRNDDDKCVCKKGYERDKNNGRCVETKPQCQPGPNEVRDESGKCVCQRGYERDKNGRCTKPADPAVECRKQGKIWDGKRCVEPPSPADECRKKGWMWTGKRCVEPPKKVCPSGTTGTPPNCKAPERPKCPRGTVGAPPNCKPIAKPQCPSGTAGVFPNCKKVPVPR